MAKRTQAKRQDLASNRVAERIKMRISQQEVPAHTLDEARRVGRAIADNYAFRPTRPIAVAEAMGMKPTTGKFRTLCGASIAYGLTEGGYGAPTISLTALGKRAFSPTLEGDDARALREALLIPRVFSEFLRRYDGAKLPSESIAQNVLAEIGVPRALTGRTLKMILTSADYVGLLREIRGSMYVDLANTSMPVATVSKHETLPSSEANLSLDDSQLSYDPYVSSSSIDESTPRLSSLSSKVFITHGRNKALIDPLKQLLAFGNFEPVVAIERESLSKPVPDKVLDDMRKCSAAIIHVDAEMKMTDTEGNEQIVLNPNVLLEIGAAMALYGRRFILLVREGVRLPSNLQGLYEVRYEGPKLDSDATIRLMKAINEFKSTQS